MNTHTSSAIRWQLFAASELDRNPDLHLAWNRLNADCTGQVFLDAEAICCALRCFGTGVEKLVVGTSNGTLRCMAVLQRLDPFRWMTFQPSQLPLGALVLHPAAALPGVADSLIAALPGFALVLSLTQLDPLYVPRPPTTGTLRVDDYIETGWVQLAGTFEEYWAARGKNLRQNMRKQHNKLATEGISQEFRKLTQAAEMAGAVARYGELESRGWKAEGGTAIHPDNDQGRFYTQLLESAASKNHAMVYEHWLANKLAASNLCLLREHTLVILKTTYDEEYTQISPAFLLRQAQIEQSYANGDIRRIEFYGPKREWHTRWTDNFRTLYHATAYRQGWIRRLAESRRKAAA